MQDLGESSLHSIMSYLRPEPLEEPWSKREKLLDLWNLMRTCRTMYISGHNLPRTEVTFDSRLFEVPPYKAQQSNRWMNALSSLYMRCNDCDDLESLALWFPESYQNIPVCIRFIDICGLEPFLYRAAMFKHVKFVSYDDEAIRHLLHYFLQESPINLETLDVNCLEKFDFQNLQHFPNLTSLSLRNCHLKLKSDISANCLEKLDLTNCCFTTSVVNFEKMTRLQTLILKKCDCNTNVSIKGVSRVKYVDISETECFVDLKPFENAEVVLASLSHVCDLRPLKNVRELNVSFCRLITDVSTLTTLRKLNISGNLNEMSLANLVNLVEVNLCCSPGVKDDHLLPKLEAIKQTHRAIMGSEEYGQHNFRKFVMNHGQLRDLEFLQGPVQRVELVKSKFPLEQLHMLSNVKHVSLMSTDVSNVSCLANVHYLDLSSCKNVTNVSALGGVHTLNLRKCYHITDVSALGNVHNLNLSSVGNHMLTDFSALTNVHTLNLERTHISDASALGNTYHLNMRCCQVEDVSALSNVYHLNLCENRMVSDVSCLKNVHELFLDHCERIESVAMMKNMKTLSVNYCENLSCVPSHNDRNTIERFTAIGTAFSNFTFIS